MKILETTEPQEGPKRGKHLVSLIRQFAADFPKLTTQRGSYNKCKFASYELVLFLRRRGFKARLIHVQGCPAPAYPNPHTTWANKRRDKWSHYIVGIGRWTIDLTARQFDADAPFPSVRLLSRIRETWTTVEDDAFLNRWVKEVLRHKDLG